jgi:hypothetical protein
MKKCINWGAVRTFGHRAAPMYQLAILTLIALGFEGIWLPALGIIGVVGYIILDVKVMFKQEQKLYWQKNPEFQRLMQEISAIREMQGEIKKCLGVPSSE